MIVHFQVLRSVFSPTCSPVPRRLLTSSGVCCQALKLNRRLSCLEESQLQRDWKRRRAANQKLKDYNSESKSFDMSTTPRWYALQRERREMALMKLHENDQVIREPIHSDSHQVMMTEEGEIPVLFHVETNLVQSLIQNANLKDPMAIKEMIEEKVKELVMCVHVNSVLGSAVPCSKNSDDIIIRTGADYKCDCVTERWRSSDWNRCSDLTGGAKHLNIDQALMFCDTSTNEQKGLKPEREQLELMFHRLSEEMPNFFEQSHDYGMYSQDLEFDNRLMGIKTKGLAAYKATVQSLKLASTAYLVNAHLEVLRLTMQPEEGAIHARWRVKGVPLHSFILRPLAKKRKCRYFDAFSVFRVGSDGLIHHHRLDKIMPDSEKIKEPSLVARIRIALGLVRPPPAISTNWMTGDPPRI